MQIHNDEVIYLWDKISTSPYDGSNRTSQLQRFKAFTTFTNMCLFYYAVQKIGGLQRNTSSRNTLKMWLFTVS
jgi:hypothetical protein